MEVGPYRVKGDKLIKNEGSWNEFANLLFGIDVLSVQANLQLINLLGQGSVM